MKINDIFYQTKIWQGFESIASSPDKISSIKKLIEQASPILDRIIETFPTYTLHNGQHQLNILEIFSKLLGDRISELSDLEIAILILSAFYHDIGMVFHKDEKQNLKDEELFSEFLSVNPSARLLFDEDNNISEELGEWYCRWSHAKRVWIYLDQVNELLKWEEINFRKELAEVCLSHNEQTKYIESEAIPSNFWNIADLKFCAILLRLADILDFDNSRSPLSVYSYLGLNKNKSKSIATSHKEWNKHLSSSGFDFKEWSRDSFYTIYFKASPSHPAVENDINEFLDIIENEFQQCKIALRSCSDRWKNFTLPEKIDRTHIYSQGYTSGSFKFTLDQKQILHLLMGENLYENAFVFLRELVQNAIDTSKYRENHEKHINKSDFTIQSIEFSSWYDSSGFKWVRIDDFGMGMTLDQIEKYFLKIGNSLYNSDEFKVSKLSYPTNDRKFTPISRFGIGILSCFMIADIIEVSTKSIYCDNNKTHPIRISLQGIDNYYFLYTGKDIPIEMPSKTKNEKGYRREVGTSIALRINPNYDRQEFKIDNLLEKLIYSSFVPIKYESNSYGTEKLNNLSDKIIKYKIPSKDIASILEFFQDEDIKEINPEIHIVPIRLNHEKVSNAEGILYVFLLKNNITYDKNSLYNRLNQDEYDLYDLPKWELNYSAYNEDKTVNFYLRITKGNYYSEDDKDEIDINLDHLLHKLNEFNGSKPYNSIRQEILLSHNGLVLPNNPDYYKKGAQLNFDLSEQNSDHTLCLGIINLKDNLRPNLNIARDKIISFPWNCFSQINFLLRNCLDKSKYHFVPQINYFDYGIKVDMDSSEVKKDELLMDNNGWSSIITIENTDITVNAIKEGSSLKTELYNRSNALYQAQEVLKRNVIFNNCNYSIKLFKKENINSQKTESNYIVVSKAFITGKKKYTLGSLPSGIVCEYENFNGLMPQELNMQLYNINHRFTKWLISAYPILENNYPYYLRAIFYAKSFEQLNTILDKLKILLTDELYIDFVISQKDFEVDINTLDILEEEEKKEKI